MRPGTPCWSGLLVSVRDAAEAIEAVAGGAAIVDVKDPARGPLGGPSPAVAAAVAAVVAGRTPWPLACGELAPYGAAAAAVVAAAVAALG
ncbi:MAG: (5-formylfuran-3-yl)methyl phosphate synthase, partial [Planctomycetaceae bacterium]